MLFKYDFLVLEQVLLRFVRFLACKMGSQDVTRHYVQGSFLTLHSIPRHVL